MSGLPDPGRREESAPKERWPAGFILIVVAAALYLGFRLVEMIGWLVHWVRS